VSADAFDAMTDVSRVRLYKLSSILVRLALALGSVCDEEYKDSKISLLKTPWTPQKF